MGFSMRATGLFYTFQVWEERLTRFLVMYLELN